MISLRIAAPVISAAIVLAAFSSPAIRESSNHPAKGALAFQAVAAVPATQIGVNAGPLRVYHNSPAYTNLIFGSVWEDHTYTALPDSGTTADGAIDYIPAGDVDYRFLTVPYNMPAGTNISCTWTGIGKLIARGYVTTTSSGTGFLNFSTQLSSNTGFWLQLSNVSTAAPFDNLNCQQQGIVQGQTPPTLRPEYVAALSIYPIIRFMDWQNVNQNHIVTWATRHQQGDTRYTDDGVSIEDMMAMVNATNTSPWFCMPYNADDTYLTGFAQYVAQHLPLNKSVYVEVGNEVWSVGNAEGAQAQYEGLQLKLSSDPETAGLLRYAEKTIHTMKIWEAAFANRPGLVRVVSSQHVVPQRAVTILTAPGLLPHVDALATAPYWGGELGGNNLPEATVTSSLATGLAQAESQGLQNKAVAQQYGVRYIAYEGGQGLQLPGDPTLFTQVEDSPQMYAFYTSFLQWWKTSIGDALVLYTSNSTTYGIVNNDTDGPAQSVKLQAIINAQ